MKHLLFALLFVVTLNGIAQEKAEYIDIVLDGKPTKMKVTRVKHDDKPATVNTPAITPEIKTPLKPSQETIVAKVKKKAVANVKEETVKPVNVSNYKTTKVVSVNLTDKAIHIIKKGDTFYSVSNLYGISIAHLKKLNNLTSNMLKVNQELKIGYAEDAQVGNKTFWIVEKGNTLYSIAKYNNTTVEILKVINNLDSNTIKIGQKLTLQ